MTSIPDKPLIRTFIVDDHPMMQDSLADMLAEEGGFQVVGVADSAATAMAAMRDDPPDLALIDLRLRDSSGLTLVKDLARLSPKTRILVVSMHEEPSMIESALRLGAHGYVTKAEATETVIVAVRTVLQGRVFAPAEVVRRLAMGEASPALHELVADLSEREREVFTRLGKGQQTRDVAEAMGLSFKTVQTYCARIKLKLKLEHGTALLTEAARWVASIAPSG